ncbi:MAG: response regulator transcription factor [Chloroflexi bacterium]|jgi:two-component system KDP operon response regulator KdpE|nr:response regulator transcription factor [Chloroflexota bacterium]
MDNNLGSNQKVFKILVVDDELPTLRILKRNLTGYGYEVVTASDGLEALRLVEESLPDLMLLDITMPNMNGLEVTRQVRRWNQLPIIVVSALGEENQKVEALELGADDYLTKPFGMNELVARIKVALRRLNQKLPEPSNIFTVAGLSIDFTRRLVTLNGQELKLTPQQYDLLRFLVQNAGRVVTHRLTLLNVWGPEYEKENQYLHVFIGQLRQKIEPDPARPFFIITERGVGYRFRSPEV